MDSEGDIPAVAEYAEALKTGGGGGLGGGSGDPTAAVADAPAAAPAPARGAAPTGGEVVVGCFCEGDVGIVFDWITVPRSIH